MKFWKRTRRALSMICCLALILAMVPAVGAASGDFTIKNGVLTKYNGAGGAVTIPEGVTEIGDLAFSECAGLTSITIPDSVTKMGQLVFQQCTGLTSITLPKGLTTITAMTFNGCSNLSSVTIPVSVTSIEFEAFYDCGNLRDVYYAGTQAQWKAIDLDDYGNEDLLSATIHYNAAPKQPTVPTIPEQPTTPTTPEQPGDGAVSSGTPISKTPNSGPVKSNNKNGQNYSVWSSPVTSYLYKNESGGLTRVEFVDDKVVVEDYDSSFRLLSNWSTQPELPIWGGFYAGSQYNFLIYGQNNLSESDSTEVIRVVKYSKDWQRISSASLYGGNMQMPFRAGSLRCAEDSGYLYIHTCRQMYKSGDGLNHQNNTTIVVRQSDMTLLDFFTFESSGVGASSTCSHSFNQFILVDQQGRVVTLDHGDASPRAAKIERIRGNPWNGDTSRARANIQEFPGERGKNATGASLGGLAETSAGYVSAYNYDGKGGTPLYRDIYLSYTTKSDMTSTIKKISVSEDSSTPVLAPTGLNGGYVLWNSKENTVDEWGLHVHIPTDTLYYAAYSDSGSVGPVQTAKASLSDCQPIYYNGKTVWYVTDNSAPVFYTLDASGVTAIQANGTAQSTTPTQPEKPGTVKTANPTNDKLTMNGAAQNPTVYKIGGSNYFKIRDVAAVLNGTEKQFSVGYSGGKVTATSGHPYEMTGTELKGAPAASGSATPSNDKIVIDGVEADVTVYKIGGSNYFKLRDLGKALNFYVGWTAGKGVYIETDKPYSK